MKVSLGMLSSDLAEQIEHILTTLQERAKADCVMLADISGQLIHAQGESSGFDQVLVAALAAGNMAALAELNRQIGETGDDVVFLQEGRRKSTYLADIAGSFVLIVLFGSNVPVGLVRLFGGRAVDELYTLTEEFEDTLEFDEHSVGELDQSPDTDFGMSLAEEMDKAFEGL